MNNGVFQRKPMSQIIAPSEGEQAVPAPTPENGAAENQNQDPALPEKYQGKSAAEVAEMHMNSEKRLGQLQNEVGQLRGLVQDLAQVQRQAQPTTPDPVPVDVSGDDLIQNPSEAIRKVVQPLLQQQAQADEPSASDVADSALLAMEQNALVNDFGDVATIAQSQEFQDFCARTSSRQADFQRACDSSLGVGQVQAARRLLEDYTDFRASLPSTEAQKTQSVVEQAKKVATEGAGPAGAVATTDPIYEADVVAMINSNPEKYRSPSFQKQLHAAIREGRYIKNG
jgi:hypothetical protein